MSDSISRARFAARAVMGALGLSVLTYAGAANAAGLYFSDRGVRPLGRGGAYDAGAEDIGAIWYNPAGLADAGTSVWAYFSWPPSRGESPRRTQVNDTAGTRRTYESPSVSGTTPVLPIPTIGASFALGKEKKW